MPYTPKISAFANRARNISETKVGKKPATAKDISNANKRKQRQEETTHSAKDQVNGVKIKKAKGNIPEVGVKAPGVRFMAEKVGSDEEITNDISESMVFGPSTSIITNTPKKTRHVPCGTEAAEEAFKWLLRPFKPDYFFQEIFEHMPLHIKRGNPNHYDGLFSMKNFNRIMKENRLNYGDQIDVVAYVEGERRQVENGMIVYPDFVWNAFNEGNSVRMRNPQAYHIALWKLCSLLQEYFSSTVGANMYLTPAHSQGFPPHYDDIDAFILQIEGKKLWKVYKPRTEDEVLPRYSSGDLNEATIGTPFMEVELSPGDMLYFPRGYIHQAKATDEHSLHITVSTNQLNTWGDLLQLGLTNALEKAIEENVEFRKSLPKDYLDCVGVAYAKKISARASSDRKDIQNKAIELSTEVLKHLSVDFAADAHAMDFIHGCMPPVFNQIEADCSIHGNGCRFEDGVAFKISNLTPATKIRWIRKRAFRLVIDENGARLFHTLANSKNAKEEVAFFSEVDSDVVPAISMLFQKHPEYIAIKDLPIRGGDKMKLDFAEELYYNGFLVTDKPLPPDEDDLSDE